MPTPYAVVLVTTPNKEEARKLAQSLLEGKLAACVNILPGVESRYWWENKIEQAAETMLLIKTRAALAEDLAAFVRKHHSYHVPEVLAMSVLSGNPGYLDFIGANTVFVTGEGEGDKESL